MAVSEYKPRGGALLVAFFVLAISLPAIGIFALSYLDMIEIHDKFIDKILRQIGWNSVFTIPTMAVVFFVTKKISTKINNRLKKSDLNE